MNRSCCLFLALAALALDAAACHAKEITVLILGEDGQPRLSMDEADRTEGGEPVRHLEIAPDGSLLSARLTEYRIDRWSPATGEHLESVLREADWWPEVNPVVVSQVVDAVPRLARFFAPGWLAVYNDDGFPQYRMYRVRLQGLEPA